MAEHWDTVIMLRERNDNFVLFLNQWFVKTHCGLHINVFVERELWVIVLLKCKDWRIF
jgi:hypothetical protein